MYVAGQVLQMQYADALRENGPFLHRMQCGTARQAAQGSVEFWSVQDVDHYWPVEVIRLGGGGERVGGMLGWGEEMGCRNC